MERETAWKKYSEDDIREMEILCENYKSFMTRAKTERECVRLAMEIARGSGYITLDEARARGKKLEAGDCVMADCMGKSLALFQIGTQGRHLLPVRKGQFSYYVRSGIGQVDSLEAPVVVDIEASVGSAPNVEFGTVHSEFLGIFQGGYRVFGILR
jgi:hypothetical protein